MAVTQNTYTGNGSTVLYSFTFPYLETTDVKVTVNGTITTAYTFANATTIQFNTAPLAGAAIRIYRQTDDSSLRATFYSGSAIRAQDLNDDFTQNLYVAQEVNNNALDIDGSNPMAGNLNVNNFKVVNLATPTVSTDASTKGYVDSVVATGAANAAAAAASASAAASSATAAANSLDTFDDRFLGAKASDPAVDNDGSALITGAMYFNTTTNRTRIYNGTLWIDAGVPGSLVRWTKTAAGGETSLSGNDNNSNALNYTPGSEQVFLNGALLTRGVDYTATTGTTITGLVALTAGDVVDVLSLNQYVVGTVPDQSVTNAKVAAGAGIAASKLSFTQAGTGAVARTVDSKLADVVSVKDFGAVGDGVADDTAAIQAAITGSASKTLFFPPGQYKITSTLNLLSNTQYLGSQNSSLNFTVSEFGLKLPASASNIEIKGLTIQGTFARGIGNDIGNTASNIKILENTISGATLAGAGYTAGIFLTNASDCIVKENKLSGNGFGPTTAYCADIAFYAPAAGTQNSRNLITGNKCFSTAASFNIVCFNVDRTIISHNICKGAVTGSGNANGYGIAIYDVTSYTLSYSTTILNEVTNNAVTNTGGSGIYVVSADNCVVSNNTLSTNAASQADATLPVGAISINGPYSSAISVTGNTIVSSTKDGIVLANTNYSTVDNNSIQAIGQHGIHLRSGGVGLTVSSNVVVAATERGIFDGTTSKTRINIANNNVYGCTAAGIELNGATKSVIANNVSSANGTYGILNNSDYNSFIGNVLLDNTTDAMLGTGTGTIKRDNKFSSGESQGTVTLSGGGFTVTTAEIRTGDIVQLTRTGIGGTLGHLTVRAIVNKTSFLIDSSTGADTSVISWQIIH